MREHTQSRILLSLLLGLLLLVLCLPVSAFAEDAQLSDGDEAGISLSTTVPPSVVSGGGAAYIKGGAAGLTFTTDDARSNLMQVLVDGKAVSPENYTVSGDPLAITLHPDFLDTLSSGEHTIEIITTNGTAVAKFLIHSKSTHQDTDEDASAYKNDESGRGSTPNTGDDNRRDIRIMLMGISLSVLVLVMRKRAYSD